jgi:hypothetical protein
MFFAPVAALALVLSGCGSEQPTGTADGGTDASMMTPTDVATPSGAEMPIEWTTDAQRWRGMNGAMFLLRCPPNGSPSVVFGSEIYTDNSSICLAAVHDRRITFAEGGRVQIVIRPGMMTYLSTKGGAHIMSGPWDAWPGSFAFTFPGRMP